MDRHEELSRYRMEQAEQCLNTAVLVAENEDYKTAMNRAYYSVFHAVRSVLALDNVEFKKHSGNLSYFREHYIKTGIFEVELSDIITTAQQARTDSDYSDFYIVSKSDAFELIEESKRFLENVKEYLREKYERKNISENIPTQLSGIIMK